MMFKLINKSKAADMSTRRDLATVSVGLTRIRDEI